MGKRTGEVAVAFVVSVPFAATLLVAAARPLLAAPVRRVAHADAADLGDVARQVPVRGSLRVEGVPFEGISTALELERFEAFAADAQIIVAGEHGETAIPPPDNAYYRGAVEGDPSAVAVLTARAKGGVRGLIMKNGVPWIIDQVQAPKGPIGLKTRKVDFAKEFGGRPFQCGADETLRAPAAPDPLTAALAAPSTAALSVNYTARVAVETDYEFFQLFGNVTDATDYAGDLFAYSSTIYENEINTSLVVSYLKLWTTSADPWTQTSCSAVLNEFVNYWTTNNSGINRTIAHMLSGRPTGCGIAYIGALCNYSYGYGVSGSLAGNFNIASPGVVWDILVVSHEIGHNFNSPHTHCYNGIGGSAQPVDQCYSGEAGCYSGSTSLPCTQGPGYGCGTIMSYCHLLSGGYSNITLTFGLGFQYGLLPGRVPTRMHDYVVSTASYNPSCLQYVAPTATQTPLTPLPTGTQTLTGAMTATPTISPTRSPTLPPTGTPTLTATRTVPPTATMTPTKTATSTLAPQPTATATLTATPVPTASPTPTRTSSLRFEDQSNGTILDAQTGLVWEKKSADGSLHEVTASYPWASVCSGNLSKYCQPTVAAKALCEAQTAVGTVGCDTCTTGEGTCNATETIWTWLKALNDGKFAGYDDWRIPKVDSTPGAPLANELETILWAAYPCTGHENPCTWPAFNTNCTPGCTVTDCSCTVSGAYTSETSYAADPGAAWYVWFANGFIDWASPKSYVDHVRAVRGPAAPCWLDVDHSGTRGVDVSTDILYIARYLQGLQPIPPGYRVLDPSIPPDVTIASNISTIGMGLDVDMNGTVDLSTDVVYVDRYLLGLSPVPSSFRAVDPSIPSDTAIAARIAALCP